MINLITSMFIFHLLEPVFIYIGPGMGGGAIAALFGLIAAFFIGLWGILYYPIKRKLKKMKSKKSKKNQRKPANKNN